MTKEVLFSIIIPTYNSANDIEQTIESIFLAAEDYKFEVILVDDCSADLPRLKNIIEGKENVFLIEKDRKTNAAHSRDIGFTRSNGDYVFFLDSDDRLLPDTIRRRLAIHDLTKGGVCFGNYISVSEFGETQSELPDFSRCNSIGDFLFLFNGDVRSSTISIKKSNYIGARFNGKVYKHQDWAFAIDADVLGEKIVFDELPSSKIYVSGVYRMSASMNIAASSYFVDHYLSCQSHINGFSKKHWKSAIAKRDFVAAKFFLSIYKPSSISQAFVYHIYRFFCVPPFSYFFAHFINLARNYKAKLKQRAFRYGS